MPAIKAEWSLSDTQLGALVTAVNVAIAILALPVSLWADPLEPHQERRHHGHPVVPGDGRLRLATSYVQLLVARFVIGVGEAGYTAPGNSLIAACFKTQVLMISIFQAAGPIGSVLGVVLGGFIGAKWGWRYAFGVVAIPGLIFALLVFFVRDYPTVPATVQDKGAVRTMNWRDTLAALFGRPLLWLIMVASAIQWFAVSTVMNWLPSSSTGCMSCPDKAGARTGLFVRSRPSVCGRG
jgi:MFS family permease